MAASALEEVNDTPTDVACHPYGWLTDRMVRAHVSGSAATNHATPHIDYDPLGAWET
ncbi:hypothetical protein [Dokdonella sp.]|uniref:hypothetical protein n=1 Tax=Dokdonella sp. TaxID=2291710 RepID=UPI0025BDFB45|nr:hypothetical protein [Dokdonella sp.]MBX3688243.1 hypothetical protein [Dokdonella sp.]